MDWWSVIGETSLAVGAGLGLIWAMFSTLRRRARFFRSGLLPVGQGRWFMLNFLSMSCYLSLVTALGLASLHDLIPQTLFWYLLGLSALAFASAVSIPGVVVQKPVVVARGSQPPADPPLLPVRQSA